MSHGANDPLIDRTRFGAEFNWTGTSDPTAALSLPTAIEWMASSAPGGGGWPEVMRANHETALAARDRVAEALDVEPPAPDSMLGSMAALPIPGLTGDEAAAALGQALEEEDRIQVPIGGWPVRAAWAGNGAEKVPIRVSAQRYNEPADYGRLAEALLRTLGRRR